MKSDKLIEAFELLDEKYIEEASPERARPFEKFKKQIFVRRISLVASLALIIAAVSALVLPMLLRGDDNDIPIANGVQFTAEEIALMFLDDTDSATSDYRNIVVPDSSYLNINSLFYDEYVAVYNNKFGKKSLDEAEMREFIDPILSRFGREVGRSVPDYSIERDTDYGNDRLCTALLDQDNMKDYLFSASQEGSRHVMTLSSLGSDRSLRLGGVYIEADQRMNDTEMTESLDAVKEKILSVFGEELPDTKIVREYNGNSDKGCVRLTVYFYDKAAHPMNEYSDVPVSNYVSLSFDNYKNYAGDIVSDGVLDQVVLKYSKLRADADDILSAEKRVRMISLAEAEDLLSRGYVFGDHYCPLCMASQQRVDFSDYGYVDVAYIVSYAADGTPIRALPFYRFYKLIGTAENGNSIYAVTNVPAVEVSGYREYFEKQKDGHIG